MALSAFATKFLLGLSSMLDVQATPPTIGTNWQIDRPWQKLGSVSEMTASNATIIADCRESPDLYLAFPSIVHGAHEVFLDGQNIFTLGDMTFKNSHSFYGAPQVSCRQLLAALLPGKAGVLSWKVACYTLYFSRFFSWPQLAPKSGWLNFFQETLNIIAGGALLVLILITGVLFWGKVPASLVVSLILANAIMATYFIASTSSYFAINAPMLALHKLADFGLWGGSVFLFNAFRMQGLFGRKSFAIYACLVIAGCGVIGLGSSGDVIQLGTMIPFPAFFGILLSSLVRLTRKVIASPSRRHEALQLLSILSFTLVALNDLLVVSGLRDDGVMFALGMVCGIMFLTLDVNERIVDTYNERDYLRRNLEFEVQQKTKNLREKTMELEKTLVALKSTQAELVHSAKMASLGTLSAGIAHEINNSLNYVNGALPPLAQLIKKSPEYDGKSKAVKLMEVMASGLELTFAIIKSLRTYTGLNEAKLKEHKVKELITTVLTIIRSKIPTTVTVTSSIEDDLAFQVNAAGINQVFMNIIVNAIDAMPKGGSIHITGRSAGVDHENVELLIQDSGVGMSETVLGRIFEPFYTTKDVGRGTGLGLHIVKTEIDRHAGQLSVTSKVGEGTCFAILLPKKANERVGEEKAA